MHFLKYFELSEPIEIVDAFQMLLEILRRLRYVSAQAAPFLSFGPKQNFEKKLKTYLRAAELPWRGPDRPPASCSGGAHTQRGRANNAHCAD